MVYASLSDQPNVLTFPPFPCTIYFSIANLINFILHKFVTWLLCECQLSFKIGTNIGNTAIAYIYVYG